MKVFLTPEAQKQLSKIPKSEQIKVNKKLFLLAQEPLMGKKLVGKFSELRSLRAWPYRIIYTLDNKNVWIVSILHRQGAYK